MRSGVVAVQATKSLSCPPACISPFPCFVPQGVLPAVAASLVLPAPPDPQQRKAC